MNNCWNRCGIDELYGAKESPLARDLDICSRVSVLGRHAGAGAGLGTDGSVNEMGLLTVVQLMVQRQGAAFVSSTLPWGYEYVGLRVCGMTSEDRSYGEKWGYK